MTQERFIDFLGNPDSLSSITYEELKTLALAYPYAHNLRYLLALKSQQDHHTEAPRNLATAAAHSLDRTRLFALIAPAQLTPQRLKEEVLELKPIETIRRELEALSPVFKTEIAEKQAIATQSIPQVNPTSTPPEPPPPSPATLPDITLPATPAQPFSDWMGAFNPPTLQASDTTQPSTSASHATPHFLEKKAPASPAPQASPQISAYENEPDTPPPPSSNTPNRSIAQELAERSVAENKDVISETLARLLAKQGYREKAIAMYERLCLAFPEKSSFFAAEIDKLKK